MSRHTESSKLRGVFECRFNDVDRAEEKELSHFLKEGRVLFLLIDFGGGSDKLPSQVPVSKLYKVCVDAASSVISCLAEAAHLEICRRRRHLLHSRELWDPSLRQK